MNHAAKSEWQIGMISQRYSRTKINKCSWESKRDYQHYKKIQNKKKQNLEIYESTIFHIKKGFINLLKISPMKTYRLVLFGTGVFWFSCWRLYISWGILRIKTTLLDLKFWKSYVENRSYQKIWNRWPLGV